jgi:hypothetical protein
MQAFRAANAAKRQSQRCHKYDGDVIRACDVVPDARNVMPTCVVLKVGPRFEQVRKISDDFGLPINRYGQSLVLASLSLRQIE